MSQADAAQGDGSEVDFQEIVLREPKSRSHVVERAAARVELGQVYESEWTE